MKPRLLTTARLSVPLASAIAILLTVHQASADTKTWDDDITDTDDWGTADNWVASGVPASTDDALFTSAGNIKGIYLGDAARTINSITFDSTTGSTPYTINLRASSSDTTLRRLTVGAGGITVSAGSHTIKAGGSGTSELYVTTGSAFNVAASSTLTFDVKLGSASNALLQKTGAGTLVFNRSNAGSGSWSISGGLFTVAAGTLKFAVSNASGNAANKYSVSDGGTLELAATGNGGWGSSTGSLTLNGTSSTSGALYSSNTNSLTATTVLLATTSSIGVLSDKTLTINPIISGTGAAGVTKVGAGGLTLVAASTYSGATNVTAGTLTLGAAGSIANSTSITVGATTTFDVSGVTGGYTLGADQTLSGSGTVTGAMTVAGTLSPGSSPGILLTGSETWVNGGDYNFQMLDAEGVAGAGFDQIQVTGTLNLSSLTAGGFEINLWSLASGPDVSDDALNFDNTLSQSWNILTTTGGITGFEASDFVVNVGENNGTGGFSNALGGGSFSIDADANNLILNFTAVPEPGAALLGGLGLLALLRRRR